MAAQAARGLPMEESLRIMRDLAAAYPDDPWYKIDLVRALDQTAILLQDPTAENR